MNVASFAPPPLYPVAKDKRCPLDKKLFPYGRRRETQILLSSLEIASQLLDKAASSQSV
jgi:hypothetical protein